MNTMQSKYKGYCNRCHFTIWKNEYINWNGNAWHTDCYKALTDPTPRMLDPKYASIMGDVDKARLIKQMNLKPKKKKTGKNNLFGYASSTGVRHMTPRL